MAPTARAPPSFVRPRMMEAFCEKNRRAYRQFLYRRQGLAWLKNGLQVEKAVQHRVAGTTITFSPGEPRGRGGKRTEEQLEKPRQIVMGLV